MTYHSKNPFHLEGASGVICVPLPLNLVYAFVAQFFRQEEHMPNIKTGDFPSTFSDDKRLWAAVLVRGVYDLNAPSAQEQEREQAYHWIFDEHDRDDIGSFNWICYTLGILPEAFRNQIVAYYANHIDLRRAHARGVKKDGAE